MAVLEGLQGLTPGQRFPVRGQRAVLGRHPECDIVLDSAAVSRHHAAIVCETGKYFLEDMGSRNGTFLNGHMIHGREALHEGDQVIICDLAFGFHVDEPGSQLAGPPRASGSSLPLLVDDDPVVQVRSSTVISKVDVSSSWTGALLSAKPEVKLKAMVEIAQNLGRAVALEDVLAKLLDSLFKIFIQADRGFVLLKEGEDGPPVPKAVRYRRADDEQSVRISRTIITEVMEKKEAILSADATSDARFSMAESIADFKIRSMMCAPLVNSQQRALGVIQIDTTDRRMCFADEDLEVLASVATQAAIAVENAQLHEDALRQRALERDLELAHQVQQGLVPSAPPQVAGYLFYHYYGAANQVGGDFFDYVPLAGGRMTIVVADVSGKGVAAALLMAKLSGVVRYHLANEPDLALALGQMNSAFTQHDWEDRFVTCAAAAVDPVTHQLTLVNAGHMAPLLRRPDGRVEAIGEAGVGPPLGVVEDYPYRSTTHALEPGACLTIFTDGISEAMNPSGELYGLKRLRRQIRAAAANAEQLGRRVLDDVHRFVDGYAQSDDMCLACVGRMDGPQAEADR
ncbi:MAG: hypothetical protein A2W31_08565 [Planctomycetes bacterium RBG_16_64_10]|nr:MAG: hypothetical protein A2W31_08565 [Planctomycetes bacterium RBG_16_64_10]